MNRLGTFRYRLNAFEAAARKVERADALQQLAAEERQQLRRLSEEYVFAEDAWVGAEARLEETASGILEMPASIVHKEVEKWLGRKLAGSAGVPWQEALRQSDGEQLFTLSVHDVEKEGLPSIWHEYVFKSGGMPALCQHLPEPEIAELLKAELASLQGHVQEERARRLEEPRGTT